MIRRAARWWPLLIALAGAVIIVLITQQDEPGPPLHPESTAADGTKALVDTLEELDVQVSAGTSRADADSAVALLLHDVLEDEDRDALEDWVAEGGTLVLTDANSPLAPPVDGPAQGLLSAATITDETCALTALGGVTDIEPGDTSMLYADDPDWTGCFGREGDAEAGMGTGHWLAARTHGDGTIVALGGPEVFINQALDAADHPGLATGLLAAEPGTEVTILRTELAQGEVASALDLLPRSVIIMMIQLAIAFGVFAWWQAVRHGRVIAEPQPVELPSSEFVAATGRLWQQARARRHAAEVMTGDLRRILAERLGLPLNAPPEQVADALATRTGADRDETLAALTAGPPADDNAMLRHIEELDRLRAKVTQPTTASRRPSDEGGRT